ncbi:MAG: hypothetical protein IK099_13390, partial [Clostridia bacterium]|nr:hypothetical protein [Clostridia bacterium]
RADSEMIFRQARRISAGILAVFQGNATQHDGKSTRIQPLSGSVNTPKIKRCQCYVIVSNFGS